MSARNAGSLLRLAWAMLAACAPIAGCVTTPRPAVIRLADLQPLPVRNQSEVIPLRVAVAAVISPKGTAESYQPLLAVLADKLGRPVELVQRRTYAEVNDLVERGDVDVAFVCTSAYVDGHDRFGMELLAAPQVGGASVYHSVLVVAKGSPAASMEDLRGKVFAFTDPMSNSGRMYPMFLVQQLGSQPERYFARTFYTYSHDDAIRAVADGLADGAAVDSMVYDFAIRREPIIAAKTRVIHQSPAFGIPPVVVGPAVRPQVRAEVQSVLFDLSLSEEGRASLRAIGVERFVAIDDSAYDSARALLRAVGSPAR